MLLQKKNHFLFLLFITGCIVWISIQALGLFNITICPLKLLTGIPCPGCGTTRAVFAFAEGNFLEALQINPLGLLISAIIFIAAGVLFYDLIFDQIVLEKILQRTQTALKNRIFLNSILFVISVNWFWNISKDL